MIEITITALEAAIEALDEKIWRLVEEKDRLDAADENNGDIDDVLLSYMNCATSLRESYQMAAQQGFQMRPYEKLIRSPSLLQSP